MTDDREPLGRIVREAWVKWASEQEDPKPSWLTGWDELDAGQREVDMRIGAAVAAPERARADAAEAKVAEMRQVAVNFRNRYAGTLGDQASDVICGLLQVADRTPLRAQGRSDGKEPGRG
jgi:hypothetical protein